MTMNNSEYTIQDIYDILESYYKVVRKRFVDTVCRQGSDFHLDGTNLAAANLGDGIRGRVIRDSVGSIAGEDISTKQLRKNLTNEITALEKGKKLLRA
jgi:hypothetical protein